MSNNHSIQNDSRQPELRTEIEYSWVRSQQYGIDPAMNCLPVCTDQELEQARYKTRFMLTSLHFILEKISEYLPPAWVALFFNEQACLLHVFGSESAVAGVRSAGFSEGTIWQEEASGTNAVGLGLKLAAPIALVGNEHFCSYGQKYACAFAPLFDQNRLLGGFALLGPVDGFGQHTLGMAIAIAGHIGSRLVLDTYNRIVNNTISEGMLVLSDTNRPLYVNSNLFHTLNIPYHPACDMSSLDDLFDPSKPELNYLRSLIENSGDFEGKSVVITAGERKTYFTITSTSFNAPYLGMFGKVILFQEEGRLKGLLRNYIGRNASTSFSDIIGINPKFKRVISQAAAAALSDSNILILGESGTGKDLIAQAIHNASPRRNNPFLAINCASLPRELIASELFGYDEGAFTGARKGGNIGKFELADQGTLFLDEIGDMPLELQATLLRVLEDKKVMRLGGNSLIPVNVRVIAATNRDLEAELARNTFRSDLYYRLSVIRLKIPPLRERPEDIPILAEHFLEKLCRRLNLPTRTLSPEVTASFLRHLWPGNVRELQNVLEGTIQMSTASVLTEDLIEEYISPSNDSREMIKGNHVQVQFDEQVIQSLMRLYDNNKSKVARALGISRTTLYKHLKYKNRSAL